MISFSKESHPSLLWIFLFLEISCYWWIIDSDYTHLVSGIYFVSGICIPALVIYNYKYDSTSTVSYNKWSLGFLLLLGLQATHYCKNIFKEHPINYQYADMIPVIQKMNQRFLTGGDIYAMIPEIWDGTDPIYLPAMWLPFLPAEIFSFDPRYVCLFAILLAFGLAVRYIADRSMTALPLLLLFTILLFVDKYYLLLSQEGLILFYYSGLTYTFLEKKWIWVGIFVSLCILSRFALLPWSIMLLLALMIWKRGAALQALKGFTPTFLILFILGKAHQLAPKIITLPQHYLHSLKSNPDKYAPTINDNLGCAKWFAPQYFDSLHTLSTLINFSVPVLCFLLFYKLKTKIELEIFWVVALKLSFVCFCNFLIIPYSYLFYTSSIISLLLVAKVSQRPIA